MADVANFWQQPLGQLFDDLQSSPLGLTSEQAISRRKRFAANQIGDSSAPGSFRLLLRVVSNPLAWVLLAASTASASLGEATNASIILVILSLSWALEFTQSYRSERAAQKLRQSVSTRVTIRRDQSWMELPMSEVVPGDVVQLSAGSIVPADGRLLSARDLTTIESSLTGESLPVEKFAEDLSALTSELAEAGNSVFMGTSVLSGLGELMVVHTGRSTELGKVAHNVSAAKPETEFERGIRAFGVLIMRTVIALVGFVFLSNLLLARPPLESMMFSVALAVGLTPEFLPMIISITLAAGAARLGRSRVIVKRLSALENLGSIDVLCSDKTGTLTLGKIKLQRYVDLEGQEYPEVLRYAALNSAFQSGICSPLDEAVLAHEHPAVEDHQKVDEIPFDFNRRRLSVVVDGPLGRELVTKGAPESVDPLCQFYQSAQGQLLPLDEPARLRLLATFQELSREGYRVLAVAKKALEIRAAYARQDEFDLCLVGLAAFLDPPRPDTAQTLKELRLDGIEVKIVTGDNELVSARICAEVGLSVQGILLGHELDSLGDEALRERAERTQLFARMSPSQKLRLIHCLRARGHVVGYLGDGINDAPSLRAADIGISVDSAVDVAKESADMILLEPGLKPVHLGVIEGRRSFGNIMKYVLMGTSSNFGNMFSMAGASLFLPFLPLLPAQLLLNTLLYDLSQLGIPKDHVDAEFMRHPQRWNTRLIRHFMWVLGPISSLFDFLTFAVLLHFFQAGPELFQAGWFVESLTTQVLVIYVIRTAGTPWSSRPHPLLLVGGLSVVFAGAILPLTSLGGKLGLAAPPPRFYLFVLLMSLVYLSVVQFVKVRFYRRYHLTQ